MLSLTLPETEYYDESKNEFVTLSKQTVSLEHSLISVSKWESKWKKPFLTDEPKTYEELLDYISCMSVGSFDKRVLPLLAANHMDEISEYINDSMTATWFSDRASKKPVNKKQVVTSEVIYYDMIALQIPFECQKWHLNRLLTLIRVCQEKNTPTKKMSKRDLANRNRALNAARRAQHNTSG